MRWSDTPEERWLVRALGRWGEWASLHWARALFIALVITVVLGVGITFLQVELTYYSMMPKASKQVRDLKKIIEEFPAASSIVVVIAAKDTHNREAARRRVERAVDELSRLLSDSKYSRYVAQVDGRMDLSFFKKHGLMLVKDRDIKRFRRMFADLNIVPFLKGLNDDFEGEYSGNEEKFSENEQTVTSQLEGLKEILGDMNSYVNTGDNRILDAKLPLALDKFLFGSPYYLNKDGTMALMFIRPTFTINDMNIFVKAVPMLESVIKAKANSLGVKAGLTGLVVVGKDEMVTSEQGLAVSTTIALILILVIMILSFRMYSAPLISGIPLVVGVLWTIGLTGFVIRRLNIMTAMYMIALIGLGVDYAIHLLTTYVQERDEGRSFTEAVGLSLRKSGAGIVMGALTTAVAFFALVIAKSEIVQELGIVAGLGILCELLAMVILVPALLGYRHYRISRREASEKGKVRGVSLLERNKLEYKMVSRLGGGIKRRPYLFVVVMLAVGVFLATQAGKVSIEGNLMKMEAKGLESIKLQDVMVKEFGFAPDTLSIVSNDLETVRRLGERIKKLDSVKAVESIAPFCPSREEQQRRSTDIKLFKDQLETTSLYGKEPNKPVDIGALVRELKRLNDNFLEMSDLAYSAGMDRTLFVLDNITGLNQEGKQVGVSVVDTLIKSLTGTRDAGIRVRRFEESFSNLLRERLLRMANPERITLSMLPKKVRETFISRDGKDFLLNIVPAENPWVKKNRDILSKQLATVTDKVTGMVLAADQLIEIAERDGVKAAIAAVMVIFLLLILDFRNIKLSLLTLTPLLLSFVSLFGIMSLTGIKFDFVNIISVPLLIGIGIDDAVHINHRYLLEGRGKIDTVVARTGKAVFLTSLTTIIGFASFIPSPMRAMKSTGIVLSVAMALAFVFSILFYPALLVLVREKFNMNILPWNYGRGKEKS